MAEVTYISEVECDVVVPDGILGSQVVQVLDDKGHGHMLRVSKSGLNDNGGKKYLPVGLVQVDQKGKRALIELPQEADSGTSRVWVPFLKFRRQEAVI